MNISNTKFNRIDSSELTRFSENMDPIIPDIEVALRSAFGQPEVTLSSFNKLFGINFKTSTIEELTDKVKLIPQGLADKLQVALDRIQNKPTADDTPTGDIPVIEEVDEKNSRYELVRKRLLATAPWNGYKPISTTPKETRFLANNGVSRFQYRNDVNYLSAIEEMLEDLIRSNDTMLNELCDSYESDTLDDNNSGEVLTELSGIHILPDVTIDIESTGKIKGDFIEVLSDKVDTVSGKFMSIPATFAKIVAHCESLEITPMIPNSTNVWSGGFEGKPAVESIDTISLAMMYKGRYLTNVKLILTVNVGTDGNVEANASVITATMSTGSGVLQEGSRFASKDAAKRFQDLVRKSGVKCTVKPAENGYWKIGYNDNKKVSVMEIG